MTTPSSPPSVIAPLGPAIERVRSLLFQPFDLGRWFVVGFCAWLAALASGGGGGFNFHVPSRRHQGREAWEGTRHFVLENLVWLIPLLVVILVFGVFLWLLFTWLSSRGHFMFLHCVRENRAEVAEPWRRYATQGDSLFLFRIGLDLVSFACVVPLVVTGIALGVGLAAGRIHPAPLILGLIGVGLALLALIVGVTVIQKLTFDFVVPVMALRASRCLAGWRELRALLAACLGSFLIYLLFQVVLQMAISAIIIAVVLVTCCCAGCLLAIPYLGTVLLLPMLAFKRAYSLHYLAQFGPAFDVFHPAWVSAPGSAGPST